jgi:hypothetical protein
MISRKQCQTYLNECEALAAGAKLLVRRATAVMAVCHALVRAERCGSQYETIVGEEDAHQIALEIRWHSFAWRLGRRNASAGRAEPLWCVSKDGPPFATGIVWGGSRDCTVRDACPRRCKVVHTTRRLFVTGQGLCGEAVSQQSAWAARAGSLRGDDSRAPSRQVSTGAVITRVCQPA